MSAIDQSVREAKELLGPGDMVSISRGQVFRLPSYDDSHVRVVAKSTPAEERYVGVVIDWARVSDFAAGTPGVMIWFTTDDDSTLEGLVALFADGIYVLRTWNWIVDWHHPATTERFAPGHCSTWFGSLAVR
jgi:hypothetical protein